MWKFPLKSTNIFLPGIQVPVHGTIEENLRIEIGTNREYLALSPIILSKKESFSCNLFLNEYPAACCGWDGQETDLRNGAYSMLND